MTENEPTAQTAAPLRLSGFRFSGVPVFVGMFIAVLYRERSGATLAGAISRARDSNFFNLRFKI